MSFEIFIYPFLNYQAVQFATGKWYGIELDEKVGKNNGTLKDVVYFSCPDKHGMFARAANVKLFAGGTRYIKFFLWVKTM